MMTKVLLFSFLLLNESAGFASLSLRHQRTALFAGFGKSTTGSKRSKKKGKKSTSLVDILEEKKDKSRLADSESENQEEKPKVDKWGLPIQTQEEILEQLFPSMPDGTELIPVDPSKGYSLSEIESCLEEHTDLNLARRFDSDGVEKVSDGREPMRLRILHKSPPVLTIENFFSAEECQELKDAVTTAHQIDSATFKGALSNRTSTSWFCNYVDVPVLLAKANQILNIPLETMEEPQIVRYKQGQEFSWHYDEVPAAALKNGGQRLATLLVYFNDIESACGGGTMFRDLTFNSEALTMQPKAGTALLFFPAFNDGKPDDRTLHRSEVMTGTDEEKWIVQMWIHEKGYDAVLPVGNSNEAARPAMNERSKKLGYL